MGEVNLPGYCTNTASRRDHWIQRIPADRSSTNEIVTENPRRGKSNNGTVISSENYQDERISLCPDRVGFFVLYSCRGILTAYLPIYLKQNGLSPWQIGVVLFLSPVGGFVGGVLSPYLTRKFSSQRSAFKFFSGLFLLLGLSFIFVTRSDIVSTCPVFHNANVSKSIQQTDTEDWEWLYDSDNTLSALLSFCALVMIAEFFGSSTGVVQQGLTMLSLGAGKAQLFGLIRAWGALGHAFAVLTSGLLIFITSGVEKICGHRFKIVDYHYAFYVFGIFGTMAVLNSGDNADDGLTLSKNRQKAFHRKEFFQIFSTAANMSCLFVLVCRNMFFAASQGFLNWHLENIGASAALIGLCNSVTSITEFFVFFATPKLIQTFGHVRLISAGILSYVCRFVIFSVISKPLHILPVEILEGASFACVWSAIVSYLSDQVPTSEQTQVQGLILSLCTLGKGLGFLVSGVLTQMFGCQIMFLVFAGLGMITFVFFVSIQIFISKR